MWKSEPQNARTLVWALPISLAATLGIDVSFSSSPYLDVSVQEVPLPALWIYAGMTGVHPAGFPHSEISGSKDICSSPEAYRSLSRLSSALSARASTPRSLKLNQTDILLRARLPAILRICPQAHSVAPLVQILIRVADFRLRHVCSSFALAQEVLGCPDVSRNQLLDCKTYQYFFFSMQFSRYMSRSLPAPVGLSRLELPTSRLSGVRSNRLSYKPILIPAATCSPMPSPA